VEEYSSRFETIFRNDTGLVLEMHWVMMIDDDGGFSLRAEWHHMSQENIDALD